MKLSNLGVTLLFILLSGFALAGIDDYPAPWREPTAPDTLVDSWGHYNRECTSFASFRLQVRNGYKIPWHSNAVNWKSKALVTPGVTVNSTPGVGAIAWFSLGHVAWVESISGDSVTIEEYNWPSASNGNQWHRYNRRTIAKSKVSAFIHFKDVGNVANQSVPLFRFYSAGSNNHFYTPDSTYHGGGGYVFERIECKVWQTPVTGSIPIYRYYNPFRGLHFYANVLVDLASIGYYHEPWGTFYAFPSQNALNGLVPIYRYVHDGDSAHFYSTFYGYLGPGWNYERIEFYALPPG